MITLYVLAFIIASLLYRRRHRHIDMRTVRRLELERYMGRWYEIARYDRPFERRLRNIEARYTLRADGNVEMERPASTSAPDTGTRRAGTPGERNGADGCG